MDPREQSWNSIAASVASRAAEECGWRSSASPYVHVPLLVDCLSDVHIAAAMVARWRAGGHRRVAGFVADLYAGVYEQTWGGRTVRNYGDGFAIQPAAFSEVDSVLRSLDVDLRALFATHNVPAAFCGGIVGVLATCADMRPCGLFVRVLHAALARAVLVCDPDVDDDTFRRTCADALLMACIGGKAQALYDLWGRVKAAEDDGDQHRTADRPSFRAVFDRAMAILSRARRFVELRGKTPVFADTAQASAHARQQASVLYSAMRPYSGQIGQDNQTSAYVVCAMSYVAWLCTLTEVERAFYKELAKPDVGSSISAAIGALATCIGACAENVGVRAHVSAIAAAVSSAVGTAVGAAVDHAVLAGGSRGASADVHAPAARRSRARIGIGALYDDDDDLDVDDDDDDSLLGAAVGALERPFDIYDE